MIIIVIITRKEEDLEKNLKRRSKGIEFIFIGGNKWN